MATFDIKVSGIQEGRELRKTWATRTVSLIDRGYSAPFPSDNPATHLVLRIDDVEGNMGSLVAPVRADVEKVLAFTADLQDGERCLVHCHAGVSRSAAMAMAILIQHGATPFDALGRIATIRPQMYPNQTIVRLIDEIFGLDGRFVEDVIAWKREQNDVSFFYEHKKPDAEAVAAMQHLKDLLG